MSYEVSLKLPETLDEQFTCYYKYTAFELKKYIKESKFNILQLCMTKSSYLSIKIELEMYINFIKESYFKMLETANKEDFYLVGWQYSDPTEIDIDIFKENLIRDLALLSLVVETPNYFTDKDNFESKVADILNLLDIEDFIIETINIKLLKFYNNEVYPE